MKKYLFLFLAVISFNSYSQAQATKFRVRSISQVNGMSTTLSNYYEYGINFGLDISADYGPHIFALKFNGGGEINILGSSANDYLNFNILYGQELLKKSSVTLEGFIGMGYIKFIKKGPDTNWKLQTNTVPNIPLSLKILFLNKRIFGMGINPNVNLNSFQILYSTNLIFQFKFR